nr:retrovirus-related Pol polyprotein from transposon TNT 1-94 [Tanacetum cinerariifolium]
MSTSNVHQQSLADVGSETRPLMLEREAPKMQKEEDLRGDDLKHYEAEIVAMNLILISIPNDIYNSVDACTTAKAMNSGNDGRNTRRSYVQEEVIEDTNVQNDAGNIQRTIRTTSSGIAANIQCYNCSEKGHNNMQAEIEKVQRDSIEIQEAKNVLCVTCAKNALLLCHDNCLAKYKLNVSSVVRRALFTTPRIVKSMFKDTTPVVSKPRFFVRTIQSTSLGLGHNLFSVVQFCNGDLEVAFRSKTCYVRNLEGDNLLPGDRKSNLYIISILDMDASSSVCLMSKASSTKSWLWHHKLSHLNFGTINDLTKHNLVDGLSKFKYGKDYLCYACERGKSKKSSHPPKVVLSTHSKMELLHMDLCRPI